MFEYNLKLVKIFDGDTVEVDIDLGFYMNATIRGRLVGVDTPERGKPDFKKATAMLENLIASESDEEGYFIVSTEKTGKYGRWLVSIENVNSILAERWPYNA